MTDKERIKSLEDKLKSMQTHYEAKLLNLEKFKEMITAIDMGLMMVDNDDIILKVYESFEKLTGYKEAELVGKKARNIFLRNGDLIRELQLREQDGIRDQGQVSTYELPIIRKDGEEIWVSISGSPVYDDLGKKIGSIGIHYDISRQKRLQKALQDAREESDQAKHAEERFLAKMSHEIRTPLNAVIGMSYLLSNTTMTGEQKEYVDVISRSGKLLLNLINDILDYSKINSGQIQVRPIDFNLKNTLQDLAKTFRMKTKDKGVEVLLESDLDTPMVVGDETLLNQVLMNLMSNAEKFTQQGSITIHVHPLAEFDNKVTLQFIIEDTGTGVSADRQKAIFQEFVQEEGVVLEDGKGGTGLGLAITQKIVEILGGKIWMESEVGVGTKMHFVLSFGVSKKEHEEIESSDHTNDENEGEINCNLRILIVEDNPMNQKYISRILERKGLKFEICANGKLAVKEANENAFDVIFMDLFMPVMDGITATKLIKKPGELNQNTPVFALTATAVQEHKEEALATGMAGFITKPFHPEQVYSILKEISQYNRNTSSKLDEIDGNDTANKPMNYEFPSTFDTSVLDTYYGSDFEYALEMFDIFVEQLRESIPVLIKSIDQEDRKTLRHIVHKLKPTFTMVGFPELTSYFEAWEQAADDHNIAIIDLGARWTDIQERVFEVDQLVASESNKIRKFLA